jgi:hypothetical protein
MFHLSINRSDPVPMYCYGTLTLHQPTDQNSMLACSTGNIAHFHTGSAPNSMTNTVYLIPHLKASNLIIPIQIITSPDPYSLGLLTPKPAYINL